MASAPELNVIGFDTVVFEGNFADYKMTGGVQFYFGNDDGGLLFTNTDRRGRPRRAGQHDHRVADHRTGWCSPTAVIDTADHSFGLIGGDLLVH